MDLLSELNFPTKLVSTLAGQKERDRQTDTDTQTERKDEHSNDIKKGHKLEQIRYNIDGRHSGKVDLCHLAENTAK